MNSCCDTSSQMVDILQPYAEEATFTVLFDSPRDRMSKQLEWPTYKMRRDATTSPILSSRFYEAFLKLATFRELPPNWDSYGAEQISEMAIESAQDLLWRLQRVSIELEEVEELWRDWFKPTAVVPLDHGGIQLEWDGAAGEIEVEIAPRGRLDILWWLGDGGSKESPEFRDVPIEQAALLVARILVS